MYDKSGKNCAQINTILRQKRIEYGFTQQQVADFLQINRTTYAKYENGRIPELDIVLLICQLYRITPNEMLQTIRPVKADGSLVTTSYLYAAKNPPHITEREMELIEQFRTCKRKERVEYIVAYYIWEEEHDNIP